MKKEGFLEKVHDIFLFDVFVIFVKHPLVFMCSE